MNKRYKARLTAQYRLWEHQDKRAAQFKKRPDTRRQLVSTKDFITLYLLLIIITVILLTN